MNDYWVKQGTEPLFPDLLWSRPENRQHAGKLLVIGGNAHGFAAPAEAFAVAQEAGAGTVRVMLPDHIRPQLMKFQKPGLELEFAPSTPSGSFASKSLAELLATANWADAVLLAGDLGRNSETAIVLEKFIEKTSMPIVLTKDAVDYFTDNPMTLLRRENVCLVLTMAQLQKLATKAKFPTAITFSMNLMPFVEAMHDFTFQYPVNIIVKNIDTILIACKGNISTTHSDQDLEDSWRVSTASKATVWWVQNPSKPFEALTSSLI